MKATKTRDEMVEAGEISDQESSVKGYRKHACKASASKRSRSSRGGSLDPEQRTILRKTRRARANDRERSRMHELNKALEALRLVLPNDGAPYTKIETLRCARNYIEILTKYLADENSVAFNRQLQAQLEAAAEAQISAAPYSPDSCPSSPYEDADDGLVEYPAQSGNFTSQSRLYDLSAFPTPDSSPNAQQVAPTAGHHVTSQLGLSGLDSVVSTGLRLTTGGGSVLSAADGFFFDNASERDSTIPVLPAAPDFKILQRVACLPGEAPEDRYHGYHSPSPVHSAPTQVYDVDSFL